MKYEIRICQCGRIHFIPWKQVTRAVREDKEILVICTNCGHDTIIGADSGYGEDGKGYAMYSFSPFENKKPGEITEITRGQFKTRAKGKNLRKILFSNGYKVYMKTGKPATSYIFGRFYDYSEPWWVSEMLSRTNPDFENFGKRYENYISKRTEVDMTSLVSCSGMSEEHLTHLAYRAIDAFNWDNLPYGYDINWCKPIDRCYFNNGDFIFEPDKEYRFKRKVGGNDIQLFLNYGYIFLTEDEFKKHFKITKGI